MRLTSEQKIIAREELLKKLERAGELSTAELCSIKYFHGTQTLSAKQIARLLRETGQANERRLAGTGGRLVTRWMFDASAPANAGEIVSKQLIEILACKAGSIESSPALQKACEAVHVRARTWGIDVAPKASA